MYSQVELISDKRVLEGFEMDVRLRVFVDVKVRDVWFKWRVDFGDDGIQHPSHAGPFPQFAFLLKECKRE